jgi:hypothetical protein
MFLYIWGEKSALFMLPKLLTKLGSQTEPKKWHFNILAHQTRNFSKIGRRMKMLLAHQTPSHFCNKKNRRSRVGDLL